jgi:hypothetical protein
MDQIAEDTSRRAFHNLGCRLQPSKFTLSLVSTSQRSKPRSQRLQYRLTIPIPAGLVLAQRGLSYRGVAAGIRWLCEYTVPKTAFRKVTDFLGEFLPLSAQATASTVTDGARNFTIDNGIVKATIRKDSGSMASLVYKGVEMMGGNGGYWEQTPEGAPTWYNNPDVREAQATVLSLPTPAWRSPSTSAIPSIFIPRISRTWPTA